MRHVANPTPEEIRHAKKIAYGFLFGIENIVLRRKFTYDKRTRIGTIANDIVRATPVDTKAVREKKRARALTKSIGVNVTGNPIVKDYFANRKDIRGIHPDRIEFYGRNHWAKSETDRKILTILAKHYRTNRV